MFLSKDTPSDIVSAEFVIQARNPMGIHQQSTSLLADIANQRRRLIAARIAIGEALASPACRLNVQALDKGAIVAAMPTTSKRISRNTVRTAARSRDHLPEPGYASIGSEGGTLMPSKQQAASSKQQAASSKQQAASSKQQAASSKQQAASSKQQASAGNRALYKAKSAKQDEFYTQLTSATS